MRCTRLLTLSLAFMVCVAPAAHADPVSIGAAILSWVGASAATASATIAAGITVAAAVGEAALFAVTVGISYVAQALRGNPQGAQPGASGKMQASGITPRTWMAGYGMTGGKLAYVNTWGVSGKTPNAYLTMVIALSDLPCASLEGVIINDTPVTYGSGSPDADKGYAIPEYNKDSKEHLWVKFHDGTQTAADSFLTSTFGSDPNYPYASSRKGIGIAYAIVTALIEPTLFSGFPTCKFILNGAKLYDPRLDTSVGGDGSHRFDDQSTWEFTSNPKVIEYNILRGITYGSRWFYGLQNLTAARLPTSSWFAAMNECDMDVDNSAGSTEPQYRCGGEIAVNVPPVNAIEELNKSCNGRLAEIGGIYKTHVGAAGTPSFSFTDADLLSTEGQTFDQFPSLSDLVNAVTASFPDPTQGWEMTPAPGRYSSDFETADGGRQLVSDVQYNMVPFPEQVQRLQKAALAEARNFRKHTIPLPPSFWFVEPLDYGSWTSTRNGYDTKTFRFDLVTDLASLDLVAVITETDPADYDWTSATDYTPYISGPLVIQRPAAQAMVGWAVEPATIYGDDGRAKPGIKLEWSTTDIDDVDGVLFQVRLKSDSTLILSDETTHSVELFQTGNIKIETPSGGTAYQVRGKYRPISTRDTDWSSWLDVTTPDIRITAQELTDDIQTDLATVLALVPKVDATQRAAAAIRSLQDDVARAATALLQVQLIIPQLSQEFQRQLDASVQALTGSDVTDFAARLFVAESTIIDLQQHKATTTDLRALDSQINTPSTGIAALISDLQETVALLDPFSASAVITQTATAVRGQGIDLDSLGSTVLQILQNLNTLQAGQSATLAYYRREISAEVEQGVSGNAKAVGELGALLKQGLNTVQASVTEEQEARVSETSALAAQNTTLLAAMSGYTAANAVASAFTSTNASVTTLSGTVSGLGSDLSSLGDTVTAQASTISGVSSQVDRVRADGYVSIATQTTPDDALARIALLVSATAGGSTSTAAIFLDALSGGDSRVIVVGSKFYVTDNTHVESLDSVLSFSGGVLTVPAARITGTLDVGSLIADNAIVGGQIVTGNTCKPFVAAQSGTVTVSATVKTEILRKTCTSLGGVIQVLANFAQVSKADSGTYSDCAWELHHFSPGLSIGGGVIASGTYYANDSGELWRTAIGNFSGVYGLGDNFDVVLFITGDGSKRPNIGKSQFQILAFR